MDRRRRPRGREIPYFTANGFISGSPCFYMQGRQIKGLAGCCDPFRDLCTAQLLPPAMICLHHIEKQRYPVMISLALHHFGNSNGGYAHFRFIIRMMCGLNKIMDSANSGIALTFLLIDLDLINWVVDYKSIISIGRK